MQQVETYLEKRFRTRPMGFVSKNDMGDRKIAIAMRSCSFREACVDCKTRISPDQPARLPHCISR